MNTNKKFVNLLNHLEQHGSRQSRTTLAAPPSIRKRKKKNGKRNAVEPDLSLTKLRFPPSS